MKIFIFSTGWPSEQQPQWGIVQRDQAVAISKLGHQVVTLYLDLRSEPHSKKLGITRELKEGVIVYCFYAGVHWAEILKKESPRLQYTLVEALFLHLFRRVIKEEGMPDIVYGHYLRYCRRALEIKRRYGIPAVGMEHWSEMGKEDINEELRQQAIETYPYLDKQLVVSEALRKNILDKTGIDTTVVNNTYGKEFFYKEHVKKDDTIRFVLTGNLRPIKRYDLVIQAVGECVSLQKNTKFTIIGDGPEREKLQEMIDAYHLSDTVYLVGRKTRDYIVEALQEADVYILSSQLETFGVAPMEALACGVPVIATDCGGSRSYMNDFNGILIPTNDVEAMSKAILYMIEHYKEFDRKLIAEDCRQRFSEEAIAKQLESIFENVIAESKKKQ
jgi:glycosyltransferase involved in cell wall biosynthesis